MKARRIITTILAGAWMSTAGGCATMQGFSDDLYHLVESAGQVVQATQATSDRVGHHLDDLGRALAARQSNQQTNPYR